MLFIKVPQNPMENTCVEVCNFIKKEAPKRVFFSEFLRTLFLQRTPLGDSFWLAETYLSSC